MLWDRCLSVLSASNIGVLWPNGWMDQGETWHTGRPQPWPHCVTLGPSTPPPKGHKPPIFGPCLLWQNGLINQDASWHGGRPWPRPHCARWGPSSPKKGYSPQLSAQVCCGQTAGWIKTPLGTDVGLSPGDIVRQGTQLPLKRGTAPHFSAHV